MSISIVCPNVHRRLNEGVEWSEFKTHAVFDESTNSLPQDPRILSFIGTLSSELMRSELAKGFPELIALGFWLRASNIKAYYAQLGDDWFKPVGLVVHYAPNNVDTQFVYSWVCSLLMGNRNLIRLGSQTSPLQQALLEIIEKVLCLAEHQAIANTNVFCRFERDASVSLDIALAADARVIWGGDDSVSAIKRLPTKARCRDISFANRFSFVVINGDGLSDANIASVCEGLKRDMAAFSQQACSSPRYVFWLGSNALKDMFFSELGSMLPFAGINQRNEQLVYAQWLKATNQATLIKQYGSLCIVDVDNEKDIVKGNEVIDTHPGQQILLHVQLDNLAGLQPYLNNKTQTLSYWGLEQAELIKFLSLPSITGVDRIVPVGQALTFSPIWDGYELLSQLSRRISIS